MNIPVKKMAEVLPFHEIEIDKTRVDEAEGGIDYSNNDAVFRGSAGEETSCSLIFNKGRTGDIERPARGSFDANCCLIAEMFRTFQ